MQAGVGYYGVFSGKRLENRVYLKLYKERRFVAGEFHVNIFVVHFRQFGHDLIALVGFGDVDGRQRGKSYLRMPERLDERAAERQAPRAE